MRPTRRRQASSRQVTPRRQNPSLADLDALRQVAAKAGPSIGPGIVDKVTAFINGLKPSDIVGGDLQGGVEALNNARALYAREAKGQAVADAIDRAGRNASKTAGGSLDAAMRSQANNLINSGTRWTPDEDAALRSIVSGTVPTNVLRAVGVLSPSTALGAAVGAGPAIGGASLGGPVGGAVGAAIPVAGFVAKKAGGAMTAGAMDNLGALTRLGGDASALTPSPKRRPGRRAKRQRAAFGHLDERDHWRVARPRCAGLAIGGSCGAVGRAMATAVAAARRGRRPSLSSAWHGRRAATVHPCT